MSDMEIRKVQRSGGSSFIVSLPKKWVDATRIEKNDPVGLIIQPDGTLLITPNTSGVQLRKRKEFVVDMATDRTLLLRELIGAYISGYTEIKVKSKVRLPADIIEQVRHFTALSIGQEVVEETDKEILVKDLLNPAEMPLAGTIRRMGVIVTKMNEDAVAALKTSDVDLAHNVIERDGDVDRLQWLIARQANLIYADVNLSRKMDLPVGTASVYVQIAKIIERIADHAAKIAHNAAELSDVPIDDDYLAFIERTGTEALAVFQAALGAFFSSDIERANDTIGKRNALERHCREISKTALSFDAVSAIHFVYISDSLRRVGDYSTDICEHVINHIISTEEPARGKNR
ncbi:phosphate uptake regulator PhoU [Methanovulcanius yangii]|uniref:phosphate uptake regulator PhoU n=1 Tax=Methanovulcanius yangii TaxID=1789227 RepID=UPI0029CA0825|nr:phosphate uptake regulator PhoU [Methanovulcanius yangii]